MKRQVIIFIFLFCSINRLEAQNLLYNSSFEECLGCPDEPGALKVCANWSIPNHSTPDLFKTCQHKFAYYDIPYNVDGHQEPHSGNAYVGIVIIAAMNEYRNYREYIQGRFKEDLQANTSYKVTFYLSWADYSNFFCDRIGYLFSSYELTPKPKGPEDKKQKAKIGKESQERAPLNTILPTSDGYVTLSLDTLMKRDFWHKVEFTYRAKGGERYMILGLFGDNATEEDYLRFTGQLYGKDYRKPWKGTYFYIDDVCVEKNDFTHH